MPPETKQIISKLSEMTCKNCIYYAQNNNNEYYFCTNPDSYDWDREEFDHCSMGKWLTGRFYTSDFASELSVEDYDDCYYQIVRAQMFPGVVSFADEYDARQQILKHLDVCVRMDADNKRFNDMLCIPKTEVSKVRELLVELWGEQE